MNKNKKLVIIALVLLVGVFITLSACKNLGGKGEVVVVTDANGVPVTDENGEAITVVLETEVVEVTNANGEKVYDENGEVKTSIIYHSQEVDIPVTDDDGKAVTDKNGNVVTTRITVPPATGGPVVSNVPMTDAQGNTAVDENGNVITYTTIFTTIPATPGDNSSNWGATYGGTNKDLFTAVEATPDGGCVALVQTSSKDGTLSGFSVGNGTPYSVIIKYGKDGKMQWQKPLSGNGALILNALDVDASGNIVAAGYSKASDAGYTNYGDYDSIIYKFNSTGDVQWVKNFGGSLTDGFNSISACPDGGYVCAGFTYSNDGNAQLLGLAHGAASPVVVKFDADGNTSFAKGYGSTSDTYNGVDVDSNGNIYVVGNFASVANNKVITSYGKADAVVQKLSSDGSLLWLKQFGGSKVDSFASVVALSDGCVTVGRSQSSDHDFASLGNQGGYDGIIAKFGSSDGAVVWNTTFRGYEDEAFTCVKQGANGSFVVSGSSYSGNRDLKTVGNKGASDAIIVTFDASGNVASAQGYGGSREDVFNGVCVLSSGEIIGCGSSLSIDGDLVGSRVPSDGTNTVGMIARFK